MVLLIASLVTQQTIGIVGGGRLCPSAKKLCGNNGNGGRQDPKGDMQSCKDLYLNHTPICINIINMDPLGAAESSAPMLSLLKSLENVK